MVRKSRAPDRYAPKVRVRQYRKGNKMVTVTTEVTPAIVDFNDILAACTVEEDQDHGAPWKEMDGWEHEDVPEWKLNTDRAWGHSQEVTLQGATRPTYMWVNHYNEDDEVRVGYGDRRLIIVSFDQAKEWLGGPATGEHKQVYWERLAEFRRRNLEQLKKWYSDGWVYYSVDCEFMGHFGSLGGIQTEDDSHSDPYLEDCKEDVALEVTAALERDGYTVVNQPDYAAKQASRAYKQNHLRWRIAYNLGFDKTEEYLAWLKTRSPSSQRPTSTTSTTSTT